MPKGLSSVQQKILWLFLALVVFGLDQITKGYAVDLLSYGEPKAFLPYFNFTLLHNYGSAFSFLSDAGGWQRWFLGVAVFVICIFLIAWIWRLDATKKVELAALSLILGGGLGNLWDRVFLGYVVDFIDWFYISSSQCLMLFYGRSEMQTCHWPAFNIADSAVFLGAVLLIIDTFFLKKEEVNS